MGPRQFKAYGEKNNMVNIDEVVKVNNVVYMRGMHKAKNQEPQLR